VIVPGEKQLRSYDLANGKIVWQTAGLTMNPIPSPVFENGMVFATSGFRGNSLKAIKIAGAAGDITNTGHVVWTLNRDTPYVPSPLVYDGVLYILKTNNGLLSAFDTQSGKPHYQTQRLEKAPNVFSSPVGAAGRVYIAGRDGTTVVLKHGPTFTVVAENTLDDGFDASPALVDRDLYLRGYKYLYAIAER
jgi:outer membrane protein assembly factor BamB